MPPRKQPQTLFTYSLEVAVDECLENFCCEHLYNIDVYHRFPPSIIDSFFKKLIIKYVHRFRNLELAKLSKLLGLFLTDRLSTLDLKCLVDHTNFIYHADILMFENTLLRALPSMSNLVFISFKASGKRVHSLPICTDSIMEVIGSHCPNLKSLDISNTDVSDVGISHLISSADHHGCPALEKLFLFESYVTIEGVSRLLLALPRLTHIGFKETGLAILNLYKNKCNVKLNLVHMNNIGCASSSCLDMNRLLYSAKLSRMVLIMAPHLKEMKVRVRGQNLRCVKLGPEVTSLNLLFSLENVSNPGNGLVDFLSSYGRQLISLTIYCDLINNSHVMQIGDLCINLRELNLRCNQIPDDCPAEPSNRFSNLQKLCLSVRHQVVRNFQDDPVLECLSIIATSVNALEDFYLAYYSEHMTDSWLEQLLNKFNSDSLQKFMIEFPPYNVLLPSLYLTRKSYHAVISKFPNLQCVGNLSAWLLITEEIMELEMQSNINNLDLKIIHQYKDQ